MEAFNSSKTIAAVATAACVGSLIWLMSVKSASHSLEGRLEKQKLESEVLHSEKLLLEKDLGRLKHQLSDLKGTNAELVDLAAATSAKLAARESEYNRARKENLSLVQVRKQRQELQTLQLELDNELRALKSSYARLQATNGELANTVNSLQDQNKRLTDDLDRVLFASVDQSQIHAARRKKDVLTVRAKRAGKLHASFEVPSTLADLSFRIKDPGGNDISQGQGVITSTSTPSKNNMLASSESQFAGNNLQRVEVTYTSKNKLKAGVYTVEILSGNLYVASLGIKLR